MSKIKKNKKMKVQHQNKVFAETQAALCLTAKATLQ